MPIRWAGSSRPWLSGWPWRRASRVRVGSALSWQLGACVSAGRQSHCSISGGLCVGRPRSNTLAARLPVNPSSHTSTLSTLLPCLYPLLLPALPGPAPVTMTWGPNPAPVTVDVPCGAPLTLTWDTGSDLMHNVVSIPAGEDARVRAGVWEGAWACGFGARGRKGVWA